MGSLLVNKNNSSPRYLLFKKITLALFIPLLLIGLIEAALRISGYGDSMSFFIESNSDKTLLVENSSFPWRYLPKKLARNPQPISLKRKKPTNTIRIFIFGESAAAGDPDPAFNMGRILEKLLESRFSEREFEVINTSVTALNSHSIRLTAKECINLDGDYWIIYMGHNEVMGPFGAGTIFGNKTPSLTLLKTSLFLKSFRIGQWVSSFNSLTEPNSSERWGGMGMFLDQKISFQDPKLDWVYSAYKKNTQEILDYAQRANVRVILSTAASNLRDSAPFASIGDGLNNNAQEAFNKGKELEGVGDYEQARKYYLQALDLDALRFRTDSKLRNITLDAALHAKGDIETIDAQAELDKMSPNGISGHEYFFEHVHFTFRGNYNISLLFAERIAKSLERDGIFPKGDWPSMENCIKSLAYTNWDKQLVFSIIEKRIQQPPFNQRSDNDLNLIRLREELSKLSKVTDYNEYIKTYNTAVESDPFDWRFWQRQALLYSEIGFDDKSLQSIEQALNILPRNAVLNYQYAAILNKCGRFNDAILASSRALNYKPDFAEAIYQSALAFKGNGNFDAADKLFDQSLQLDSNMKNAWIDWGIMFESNQQTNNAETVYAKALESLPNQPDLNYRMGVSLQTLGKHESALRHFKHSIKYQFKNPLAHFQIGVYYVGRKQYEEAVSSFNEAVYIKPDFSDARFNLGVGLIKLEKYNRAIVEFEKLINQHPENQEFLQYLNYSRSKLRK